MFCWIFDWLFYPFQAGNSSENISLLLAIKFFIVSLFVCLCTCWKRWAMKRWTRLEFDKNKCFKNEWWFTAGWCIAFDS